MKRNFLLFLIVAIVMSVPFAFGQEEETDKTEIKRTPRPPSQRLQRPVTPGPENIEEFRRMQEMRRARSRTPGTDNNRRDMARNMMMERQLKALDDRFASLKSEHEAFVAELEAVKTTAEKEKAKETIKVLQKLIDKKNAEFEKSVERLNENRKQLRTRLEEASKQAPKTPDVIKRPAIQPSGQAKPVVSHKKTAVEQKEKVTKEETKEEAKKEEKEEKSWWKFW